MSFPQLSFSLHFGLGDYGLDLNIGKLDEPEDEPPYIDEKRAAHLGAPMPFGLTLRPEPVDGE